MVAWHPHPDTWALVVVLAGGYLWAVRRIGPSRVHPIERPVSRRKVVAFFAGVATIAVAAGWPVHDLGEGRLFSFHMLEHMLLALVAPPLLLAGMPAWLWRELLGRGVLLRVVRILTRPAVALVSFNVMIAVIHVPAVVELMLRSEVAHLGLHALLFGSALAMWSPVLTPLIELPRLSYPGRMVYLFLQSLVPTVPASFLTFGDTVLYHSYAAMPQIWGVSSITDQRIAGLFMKLAGGAILWGFIAVYFFRWFRMEESEGIDVLDLSRVERDLRKAELT